MLVSLDRNGRVSDGVHAAHVDVVYPRLCQWPGPWTEEVLPAVGTFLLDDVVVSLVPLAIDLYVRRRVACALGLLAESRCRPVLSAALETCAQAFLPDSASDFCACILVLAEPFREVGPLATRVLQDIIHSPVLSASCALSLCDLMQCPEAQLDLCLALVLVSLPSWPASAVSDLGRAVWRRFRRAPDRDAFVEELLGRLPGLETPNERQFHAGLAYTALADSRPKAMKQWLLTVSDLVRRRCK